MSWWVNASQGERLAQIDGGLECGMTAKQVAMNCCVTVKHAAMAVRGFAELHGRRFPARMSEGGRKRVSEACHERNVRRIRSLARIYPDQAFSIFTPDEAEPFLEDRA